MKRLVFIIAFLVIVNGGIRAQTVLPDTLSLKTIPSAHDKLFAPDKGHHFMASAFLTGMSFYTMRQEFNASESASNGAAVGISLSIGIAKEIYDGASGKGTASFKDIIADAAGIAAAIFLLNISSP